MDLLTETCILFYFILGLLNNFLGEEKIGKGTWEKMQMAEIYLILITALLNVVQIVYNTVLGIIDLIEERKYIVKAQKQMEDQKGGIVNPQEKLNLLPEVVRDRKLKKRIPRNKVMDSSSLHMKQLEMSIDPFEASNSSSKTGEKIEEGKKLKINRGDAADVSVQSKLMKSRVRKPQFVQNSKR
jgi:hypothetical protein